MSPRHGRKIRHCKPRQPAGGLSGPCEQRVAVLDGRKSRPYDRVESRSLIFSPDSRRVAFVARRGKDRIVVVDGKEQKPYDRVESGSLIFSPDSRQLAYVARKAKEQFVVLDGNERNITTG